MGSFKLEEVPETEFPTLGRSFADDILDAFVRQSSIVVRVRIYTSSGHEAQIPPSLTKSTLDARIAERKLHVEVGAKNGRLFLRKK